MTYLTATYIVGLEQGPESEIVSKQIGLPM